MPATVLTVAAIMALAASPDCGAGYGISPVRIAGVAQVESGNHPLAINVNGPGGRTIYPESMTEALATARVLIAENKNIDVGLMQENVASFEEDGLTLEKALNACDNIAAASKHLSRDLEAAWRAAHSRYNTGNLQRGIDNGYVAKITKAIERVEGAPPEQSKPATARVPTCPKDNDWKVATKSCVVETSWRVASKEGTP